MVTRRANGRQHEVEGEGTPQREEGSNNPMLRQILECVDQLQQQNQTLQPSRKKDTFNSTNFTSRQGRGFDGNKGRFKSRYQGSWSTDRSREVDLTPLNTSRTRILKDVYQFDLLRLPPPAEGAKGPDLDKWCDYHGARGHGTENFWTLMNKIEKLIKDGFLRRYVERRRSNRGTRDEWGSSGRGNYNKRRREDSRRDEKEEPKEIRGVVTTIAGGSCGGGETSSARKKYVRSVMSVSAETSDKKKCRSPVICFSDEDMKGIKPHEDDPMTSSAYRRLGGHTDWR
ncbi:hypothetical protein SESBI_28429 [Sesbania bispinosa]|nr:hypothetical protein SESBI_28429 [Sesbania bispinosa]